MKPEIQINTNSPEDMRTSYKGSRIFSQKPQGTVRELNSKQVIAHTTSVSMDSNLQVRDIVFIVSSEIGTNGLAWVERG